jgi:hypothetical protein
MELLSITNETNEKKRPFTGRHSNFVHLTLKCYSVPEVPKERECLFLIFPNATRTTKFCWNDHVLQGGPFFAGRLK